MAPQPDSSRVILKCVCVSLRRAGPVPACGQRAGDEVASHGGGRAVSVSAGRWLQGLWWDTHTHTHIRKQQHARSTAALSGNYIWQHQQDSDQAMSLFIENTVLTYYSSSFQHFTCFFFFYLAVENVRTLQKAWEGSAAWPRRTSWWTNGFGEEGGTEGHSGGSTAGGVNNLNGGGQEEVVRVCEVQTSRQRFLLFSLKAPYLLHPLNTNEN